MRVLVCGGRDYADRERVFATLDELHARTPISAIMHGNAKGADSLADDWAKGRCWTYYYPADWRTHGKAAGPIRNQEMLDDGEPGLVVAFPGGPGTADMVRRAKAAGVKVVEVKR